MLFDRATANHPDTGDYLNVDVGDSDPIQQRNAVTSVLTVSSLTPARKNFPADRSFNAVCLTIGQLTESSAFNDLLASPPVIASDPFAGPRPGHEADSLAPDPPAGNDPAAVLIASKAVEKYCLNNMDSSTGTRLYVPIPERDLLLAHTEALRIANLPKDADGDEIGKWWEFNFTTAQKDQIFQHLDHFVQECLTNANITPFIAGFFLLDEPDIPRRLPLDRPEVVGLVAGKVVADAECAFRVMSTNRPTTWEWEFLIDGVEVVTAGGSLSGNGTFEPVVRFPNTGEATVFVRVGNWHGKSDFYQFRFLVVASETDLATPVITGLYSRTTDGIVQGAVLTNNGEEPPADVVLQWTPGGAWYPENGTNLGQDGLYGVCAVHQSDSVISTFQGDLSATHFWPSRWNVPAVSSLLIPGGRETPIVRFPAFVQQATDEDPHATQLFAGCSVILAQGETEEVTQRFTLEIQRRRVNPFPSWLRPGLIQRLAERIHSKMNAWWKEARPIRIFMNFNGGIIEERFRGEATAAMGTRKLVSMANFDATSTLPNFGTRHQNEKVDSGGVPEDALRKQFKLDYPTSTSPAAAMRLKRTFEATRQVLYSVDDYPVISDTPQLIAKFKLAEGNPSMPDGEALSRLRGKIHTRDVVRASHNYGRFRADIAKKKASGESGTEHRRSIVWVQMWGSPRRSEGTNSLNYSLGTFADLPKDPQSPAANDGWELDKCAELEARLQALLPIFMGAEGIGWFAQFFYADALIYLLYDKIAAENLRYEDFRHNSILLSSKEGASVVDGRGVLGWTDVSAPPRLDAASNARELTNIGGVSPKVPEGRLELDLMVMMLERRTTLTSPARPAGKQFLFLANPSWRTRRVELCFEEVAARNPAGEGWQLYQYSTAISSLSGLVLPNPTGTGDPTDTAFRFHMPTGNDTKVVMPLLANEIRIYEREVLA